VTKYLILENGRVFKGKSFGYDSEAIGELVFTTKMTGYLETLSDPAHFGQIVLQTFPLIGNYGVIPEDFGPGPMCLKAYIVREWCQEPSNFRSEGNLDSFLCDHKVPGFYDIDTRALTRIIRDNGTMNAMISNPEELTEEQWKKLKEYKITKAVAEVCAESNYSPGNFSDGHMTGSSDIACKDDDSSLIQNDAQNITNKPAAEEIQVAMWDFGDGFRASELLLKYDMQPITINHAAPASMLLAKNPDGIMLTCGPGNPTDNPRIIEEIKKLCEKNKNIPVFAMGLGHQMLAIARGAKTVKLKFGNRGANQPVKEQLSNRAFVTKQNHGYAVEPDSLPEGAVLSYLNINDGTCEGIDYYNIPAFSVQFEPTEHLMQRFRKMIIEERSKHNAS
jgi:carbamoyl-phosphate synthase small subunit